MAVAALRSLPMRLAAILSLAITTAFTGCSISTPSGRWTEIQRHRLLKAHDSLDEPGAVEEVIAQAPYYQYSLAWRPKSPQQPKPGQDPKLDQRLPGAPQSGPRRFRHTWQPLEVTLDYGVGEVMARAEGTRLNDRADAKLARLRLDSGTGAALHAEWWSSDGELFADKFINDGIDAKPARAELGGADLFPHLSFDQSVGGWMIPMRLGLFADWQQLDHQEALVEREWLSFGPRLVIEPSWQFLQSQHLNLSLVSRLGVDAGAAWFTEEFRNGDDRDFLPRLGGELSAGLRASSGSWHLELGYRLRHARYGAMESELFGSPDSTDLQSQQVFVGFGVSF